MSIFSFSLPIGWNEVSAIATAAAVIVALFSNYKASKQTKVALQMQEQTKNVQLIDKRIAVADSISQGKTISVFTLRVLFNKEIYDTYQKWQVHIADWNNAKRDEEVFFKITRESDDQGGFSNPVEEQIKEYERDMSRPDCPDSVFKQYNEYCNEHETIYTVTGYRDDLKLYNHAEINKQISKFTVSTEQDKKKLLDLIEKYIILSIKKISN